MEEQKELCKILHLPPNASWAEIYVEIGKLQEKSRQEVSLEDSFPFPPQPPQSEWKPDPNIHYCKNPSCYGKNCMWR